MSIPSCIQHCCKESYKRIPAIRVDLDCAAPTKRVRIRCCFGSTLRSANQRTQTKRTIQLSETPALCIISKRQCTTSFSLSAMEWNTNNGKTSFLFVPASAVQCSKNKRVLLGVCVSCVNEQTNCRLPVIIMVFESMHKGQSGKKTVTCPKSKEGERKRKKQCNSRESNPGLIRGRDLSYHLTTIALFGSFTQSTWVLYSPFRLLPFRLFQSKSLLSVIVNTLIIKSNELRV